MRWKNFEIESLLEVVDFRVVSEGNCCQGAHNPQNDDEPEIKYWNPIFEDKLDFKSPFESLEICLTQHIELFNLGRRAL